MLLVAWAAAWAGILQVDVLDVGQGDAILLRTPAGKNVLIDAGDGQTKLPALLAARSVHSLDLVIASHPHADHIGGMDQVLSEIPVRLYVDNGVPHTTMTYEKVMKLVEAKQIPYRTARVGQVYKLDDGIRIEVLNPGDTYLRNTGSDLNANSVVVRVDHRDSCFLFPGDAEPETEQVLLHRHPEACEVLKVAHHGSNHSSTEPFLKAVQPKIALISVGRHNRYGHPGSDTLERLRHAGATIYRTDLDGTIHIDDDGRHITVTTDKPSGTGRAAQPSAAPTASVAAPETLAARSAAPARASTGLVDINRAELAELESLPGIGPVKATAIVQWRETHGAFQTIEDLQKVSGIGPATLAKLRDRVTVGEAPAQASTR